MPLGDPADPTSMNAQIAACAGNDPCAASWQEAYAYHADQMYNLAVFQALQGVVFAGLQYASQDRTADLQYDIANRQMLIAEEEYQRYKDNYVECEDALAAEICAMECEVVDYETRADRAMRDVRRQYGIARSKLERARMRYCAHDMLADICDMDKEEALAVVLARDIAYRYAETYRDILDERRWTRRVAILQHGRNIMTGQSQMYDSGAGAASVALQARGDALGNLLGSLSGTIGGIANARVGRRLVNYQIENSYQATQPYSMGNTPVYSQSGHVFQSGPGPHAARLGV